MDAIKALRVYNSLSNPPQEALKSIDDGVLKGKLAVNPQWRYKAMTRKFGLAGLGWRYEIQRLWTEPGAPKETLAFAQVAVYVKEPEKDAWSDPIIGLGGSKLVEFDGGKQKSNDEGYKMALTDALSNALKMLGVAASVYEGRWDGSKYKANEKNAAEVALKGGQATPEEQEEIKALLKYVDADKKPLFSKAEKEALLKSRQSERTAAELIDYLKKEVAARLAAKSEKPVEAEKAQ